MDIFKSLWSKTKTRFEDGAPNQPKMNKYFDIQFVNHENPENSFSLNNENPQLVYYARKNEDKNNPFYKQPETEFILKPKRSHYYEESEKELRTASERNILLSEPSLITWQNKNAYIFKVESTYFGNDNQSDLEFVIYIPVDSAVKWLKSTIDKSPDYMSEQPESPGPNEKWGVKQSPVQPMKYSTKEDEGDKKKNYTTEEPVKQYGVEEDEGDGHRKYTNDKVIKYGVEEDEGDVNREYTIVARKSESTESSGEGTDADEVDDKGKKGKKDSLTPNKLKEKKVRGPKKTKKKAKRIITTYELDEDEVSLGRLRPKEDKEPVKIVARDKLN